jgi:HD-like signal output (HDOD) protein
VIAAGVVASVLHDAGKLVLAARLPHEFELSLHASRTGQRPLYVVEKEQLGTTHAEIGAYLLGLWGLSSAVVDAVCRHHQPAVEAGKTGLDVLAITHIADGLACEAARDRCGEARSAANDLLNYDYLAAIGVEASLPAWRVMARQALVELQGE